MAQKAIREYDAKKLFANHWQKYFSKFTYDFKSALVHSSKELKQAADQNKWLKNEPLVVKPDMLFGKRGLNNLVYLKNKQVGDVDLNLACNWIDYVMQEPKTLHCGATGQLDTFIVEPFVSHKQAEEFYISCTTDSDCDILYLSAHGGVEVEKNWDSVHEIKLPILATSDEVREIIKKNIPLEITNKESLLLFACGFYDFFKDFHFAYLELNPFVLRDFKIFLLDLVARVDSTAKYLLEKEWQHLDFPAAFGEKELTQVEKDIQKLDENSGSSLKLSILNPEGIVWMLVAGGGASVVYADSVANLWGVDQLANYGEYSGNPTTDETYFYTKGLLELMTQQKDQQNRNKILIIGGAIANFTDVAKTFDGIIKAFNEMHEPMKAVGVRIFVRRGGPNYEIGLKNIESSAQKLNLPIQVYGPETHLTDIVRMALAQQHEGVNV